MTSRRTVKTPGGYMEFVSFDPLTGKVICAPDFETLVEYPGDQVIILDEEE